jgi:hypothetical protein
VDLISRRESGGRHDADILAVDFRDHATDCSRIQRAVHQVQQHLRLLLRSAYLQPQAALVVVPRPVHGNQRVLSHRLEVSQPRSRKRMRADRFVRQRRL